MKTKIINDKWDLNRMELDLSDDSEYRFEDSNVRKELGKLGIGLGCLYHFFETTLNPKADEAIKEAFRSFEHGGVRSWHFSASMMKLLLEVIHNDSEKEGIAHIYVEVHDVDVHTEQAYWQIVHILKDITSQKQVSFEKNVERILENSWDEIQECESPFNYNMGEFQLLKDREIQPLLLKQGPVLTGKELKRAADWLLQYEYIYYSPRTGSVCYYGYILKMKGRSNII
jgi:hypothetical protein